MRLKSKRSWTTAAVGILVAGLLLDVRAEATVVQLKDGRILRGRAGECTSLAELAAGGENGALKQIVFVNDDLRITFVSRRQIQGLPPDTSLDDAQKFDCEQPARRSARTN